MEIGIDSFAAKALDTVDSAINSSNALTELIDRMVYADEVGLDSFGVGQHFRKEFLDSAPAIILAAAAARTKRIRLTSAVTVLSAADPVRVFQDFATLDLISQGRAEMVVGRGSFTESFPLFGLNLEDYDALFAEKLDLLLKIRAQEVVNWSGAKPAFSPACLYRSTNGRNRCVSPPITATISGSPSAPARINDPGVPPTPNQTGKGFCNGRG